MMLMLRRFVLVAASASALMMLAGSLPLIAQEPTVSKSETKSKTGKRDPSRQVPRYFGQVGLTDQQRESIYAIQAKQMPKIEALEKQIENLRAQMLRDCEAILTPPQKQQLDHRRASAAETRSKKSAHRRQAQVLNNQGQAMSPRLQSRRSPAGTTEQPEKESTVASALGLIDPRGCCSTMT